MHIYCIGLLYLIVFDWLTSFVTGRTYAVRFGGATPPPRKVRSGIPQGSILGPLLYILYTADVAALVESLGLKVHLYADDTQLYDFCSPSDAVVLASRVNTAIEVVSCWMSSNRLCLNLDKTKYLWFGTRQKLGQRDTVALSNISAALVSDTVARNLGHSLTRNALLTLVHAFVCSRLDFCNSAMYGINSYLLDRLQSILNAAARLTLRIPKFSSISSSIRDELHWLPVRSRIVFKHRLLVRSCIAGSAPSYLAELCVPVSSVAGRTAPVRTPRGATVTQSKKPCAKTTPSYIYNPFL